MDTCPDCLREIWSATAVSPDGPGFCECPAIRPKEFDFRREEHMYTEEDESEE